MENRGDTLSQREDPCGVSRRRTESVFLEVECDRPLVGPARHSLEGMDRVAIGRAPERELQHSAGRVLTIGVPDEPLEGDDLERRDRLVQLLRESRGNLSAVARSLGKGRTQISRWMRTYGLLRSAFRRR